MRRLVIAAAALAALVGAPQAVAGPALLAESHVLAAAPTGSSAKQPQVLLVGLRACTRSAYHAPSYRCLRDERARPFVSDQAICTVEIRAFSAVTVRARMQFAGGTQYSATRKVRKRTRLQLAFGISLPAALPAGSYRCEFTVGKKKASATLRSAGPAGPVAWNAVCTTNLLRPDNSGCSTDQGAAPLPASSSLSCSGWLVGQQGKRVTGEMLYNDNGVWTRLDGGEVTVTRPIFPVYLTVPTLLGGAFVPGQYACRYSVEGRLLAEKLFTVA